MVSLFFFISPCKFILFFWTSDSNWIISSRLAMLWTCLCFHDKLANCFLSLVSLVRPVLGKLVLRIISPIAWSSQLWSLVGELYSSVISILIYVDSKLEGRWRRYMTLWLNTFFLSWRILNTLTQSKPFPIGAVLGH